MTVKHFFDLDKIPASFGSFPHPDDSGKSDRSQLDACMSFLNDAMWKAGGFKFVSHKTTKKAGMLSYMYRCAQDYERCFAKYFHEVNSDMESYPCESHLLIAVALKE